MAYNTTVEALAGQRVEYTYVNAVYADLTTHLLSAKVDYYHYGDKSEKVFSETQPEISEYVEYQPPKYEEVKFVATDADAKVIECGLSFSQEVLTKQRDAVNNYIPNAFNSLHSCTGEYRMRDFLKTLGTKLPWEDVLQKQIVPWNYAPWKVIGMTPNDCRGISFAQVDKAYELLKNGTRHGAWQRVGGAWSPVGNEYKMLCILPQALRKYLQSDKSEEFQIVGIDKHTLGLDNYADLVMYPMHPRYEFLFVDDTIWLSVDELHTDHIDEAGHEGVYAIFCYSDAARFALPPADGKIGVELCDKVVSGINDSASLGLARRDAIGSTVDYQKAFVRIDCNIGAIA